GAQKGASAPQAALHAPQCSAELYGAKHGSWGPASGIGTLGAGPPTSGCDPGGSASAVGVTPASLHGPASGVVCVSSVSPSSRTGKHAPTRHSKPPLQVRPQIPQLSGSFPGLTQMPSHATRPLTHSPPTSPAALQP